MEYSNLKETYMGSLAELHDIEEPLAKGNYFTLTVVDGPDFGLVFQLEKPETVIGRKEEGSLAEIQLDDVRISRKHSTLIKRQSSSNDPSHIVIKDENSKNGTYLNGQRLLDREIELYNGDKIQVGDTVLKFEVKDQIENNYQERLYEKITRDPLTGLWNFSYGTKELRRMLSLGSRYGVVFSLLLIEIDKWESFIESSKKTSTTDVITKKIANKITNELKDTGISIKFSHKQFLILLPDTNLKTALDITGKLHSSISAIDFSEVVSSTKVTVSISIGQYPITGKNEEDLLKNLEDLLQQAIQAGGNKVQAPKAEGKTKSKKRSKLTLPRLIILLLVISFSIYAYKTWFAIPTDVNYSGMVEVGEVQVGSLTGGRVKEVLFEEGSQVKAGDVLVKFELLDLPLRKSLLEARVEQARASIAKIKSGNKVEEIAEAEAAARRDKAKVELLKNGFRPQEISQVKIELEAAKIELKSAELNFERINEVYQSGYTTKQLRDAAAKDVEVAKNRIQAIEEKLSLLQSGNRVEDIKAAEEQYQQSLAHVKLMRSAAKPEEIQELEARLKETEKELELLTAQFTETEVVVPSDSRIQLITVRKGDIVAPGKAVAKLLSQDQIWVRIFVPEPELGYLKVGQAVDITIDSFPDRIFTGRISQVSNQAEFLPRNVQTRQGRTYQVFGVKVMIDDKQGLIKSGMAANVKFKIRG